MRNAPILVSACFFALILVITTAAQEKPGLSVKDLEPHTKYFDISNELLTGEGADFFKSEFKKSQFVLLGEYHGSKRISQLTKAIIPVLHESGYRNFALEIGPVSVEILRGMTTPSANTVQNLHAFNTRFHFVDKNRTYNAIPFFDGVEDAEFLKAVAERKWNLIGLDQEFSFSYLPLFERMYNNLDPKKKRELKAAFDSANKEIATIYERDAKGEVRDSVAIYESKVINNYLDLTSAANPKNKSIADAIRKTVGIYRNNALRKYYEANSTRVDYMKENLAAGMKRVKFSPASDRLILKMGAVHTGRGFSPLSLFEIGNTLSEIAEMNGRRSLHINFGSRYYTDEGKVIDALEDTKGFLYRFHGLAQMGRKDKWTVIDLRPLREAVFYHRKFKLDEVLIEIFKNHDLFIIPPTEEDVTPNYSPRK